MSIMIIKFKVPVIVSIIKWIKKDVLSKRRNQSSTLNHKKQDETAAINLYFSSENRLK